MSLMDKARKNAEAARKNMTEGAAKPGKGQGSDRGFEDVLEGVFGSKGAQNKGAGNTTDGSKTSQGYGDTSGAMTGGAGTAGKSPYKWKDYTDDGTTPTEVRPGPEKPVFGEDTGKKTKTTKNTITVTGDTGSVYTGKGAGGAVDHYGTGGTTPEDTAEELEEARNQAAWMNPDNGDYLCGYAANDPKIMDERQVRSGFRRWMHSFVSGVPFSRHRSGTRFLLRKDDLDPWEINVIIYGDLFGGYIYRGSKLKVRGRRDNSSGDLIAQEIIIDGNPVSSTVTARGLMSAGTVRVLTLLMMVALVFVLYGLVLLLFGAASAVVMFFRMLIDFIKLNWVWMVLLIVGFNWIRQRMRRWFR